MSVLIVEDEETILNGLVAALSGNYTVIAAQTPDDAIRQFAHYRHYIDLVIADVTLPAGVSGVELARRFREENAGLPIILMSGLQPGLWTERDSSHLNWLGPHSLAFLQKPFSVSELMAHAHRLTEFSRTPRARTAN